MDDTRHVKVLRCEGTERARLDDDIVVEEPLEIRVNNSSIGVTMRTPGADFNLAVGQLWTEGIIHTFAEIGTIAYCPNEDEPELRNVINVMLLDSSFALESTRRTWANSSCGLCGKSTIESIHRRFKRVSDSTVVDYQTLFELPERMRRYQTNFERTGGIHAAALFDASGRLVLIREDLGRHNAVDKVLGASLYAGVDTGEMILMVSGRLGFEIAQKAAVAGIPIIASVSAPSSLAVELANEFGITAAGFVRDRSMNIYSHPHRVLNGISEHFA